MRGLPRSGALFLAAILALVGLPPFGLFVSEVMILGACFSQGFPLVASAALVLLVIAFAGLLRGGHAILCKVALQDSARARKQGYFHRGSKRALQHDAVGCSVTDRGSRLIACPSDHGAWRGALPGLG